MREKGMLVTCNRCGCTKFLKLLVNDFVQFDGDFNGTGKVKIQEYEDLPDGWSIYNGNDLCPKCTQQRQVLMEVTGF
jgi:hypothetical protein